MEKSSLKTKRVLLLGVYHFACKKLFFLYPSHKLAMHMQSKKSFEKEFSKVDTKILLEVRGKKHGGKISELPFYKKSYIK